MEEGRTWPYLLGRVLYGHIRPYIAHMALYSLGSLVPLAWTLVPLAWTLVPLAWTLVPLA